MSAGDPTKTVRGKLTLEFKAPEVTMKGFEKPERVLKVDHDITAKGCGVMARKTKTKARPQKDLSLKVAGKAFAIQGATVKKGFRGHVLRLTSQPSGCKSSGNSDLVTELRLEGNPPKVTHAYLAGAMFASQYNSEPRGKTGGGHDGRPPRWRG